MSRDRIPVSRDREEADAAEQPLAQARGSVTFRYVHRHGFALFLNNVSNRRGDVIAVEKPARASMSRPSFSALRSQQLPTPMPTNLANSFQSRIPAIPVQQVRSLAHETAFAKRTRCIRFKSSMTEDIAVPVHRTRWRPVQMRTVVREGDQVRHGRVRFADPSRSGLSNIVQNYKDILGFVGLLQ